MTDTQQPQRDFLTRLVDKAFGDGLAIEPYLPSVFEPRAAWMDGSIERMEQRAPDKAGGDNGVPDRSGVVHPADISLTAQSPPDDVADILRSDPPLEARPPRTSELATLRRATNVDDAPAAAQPPQAPGAAPLSRHATQDRTGTRHSAEIGADRSRGMVPQQPPARDRRAIRPAADASRPAEEPIFARDELKAAPAARASAHPAPEQGTLVPVATPVTQRFALATPPSARRRHLEEGHAAAGPDASPGIVNVTIGRVEVRAAATPPSRPASEKREPRPLSLDDYLKRRSGR